ncbi:hypothetical protein ACRJ4B_10900 [Streptomyces sp. GTA36]
MPMFTQAYRHPGLDDRIVVRLVAAEQGEGLGQGLGTGFLGLEPEGEPTEVGLGQPRALGFPEWVLVHHPSDGHLAMSLVEEMNKVARTAKSRPKKARATYESIGERLAGSVPHFLPTFYEQAGRVFLAADESAYASQMFVNARKAETAHALPFDEERMDAVFLEFALAEAVPTKMLSSYAKGLSSRVPAATAFRHVRGLFVRLAAHGLPPSSPGAGDLRRLAKAVAGRNALVEEVSYLREMLTLPGTVKAPPGWWKAHRPALLELTRQEPAFRGTLLELMPSTWEREELPQWLDLLEKSGATAGLCDATLPAEVRPADGTAGWTRRFLELWRADYHLAPAELYPLVDRMAGTLRAELESSGGLLTPPVGDVNLLDQLLALGIPVADPEERHRLNLVSWAACEHRRDLVALEADHRFRRAFRRGCPEDGRADHPQTVVTLAGSPGGRPMLAEWVGEVSRRYITAELPAFESYRGVLQTLSRLPGEVLAIAESAVREALSTGMAPALSRALRSGLLDELGWPAWEEALEGHESGNLQREVLVTDAWPHLIVLAGLHLRVIGSEGTALAHELSVPDQAARYRRYVDYHYVDGELFVWWRSVDTNGSQGYWHHNPSQWVTVDGSGYSRTSTVDGRDGMGGKMAPVSLPLPGGGRTTGHGVLRRGDTVVPGARQMIGDGTSYWVWSMVGTDYKNKTWHAYDPVSDTQGEPGQPDWFGEGLRAAPEGSTFEAGWLLPAPSVAPGPMCAPVDGVLGWRVVTLPDGSRRGEDLAGRSVVVPPGRGRSRSPRWVLEFPGADRPLAVVQEYDGIRLLDGQRHGDGRDPAGPHRRNLHRGNPPPAAPALLAPAPAPRPEGLGGAPPARRQHRGGASGGGREGAARGHGGPGRSGAGAGRRGRAARDHPQPAATGRPRGAARRHLRGGAVRRRAAVRPRRGAHPARHRGHGPRPGGAAARTRRRRAHRGAAGTRPQRPQVPGAGQGVLLPRSLRQDRPTAAAAREGTAGPQRTGPGGQSAPRPARTGCLGQHGLADPAHAAVPAGSAVRLDGHHRGSQEGPGDVPRRTGRPGTRGAGPRSLAPCPAASGAESVPGARLPEQQCGDGAAVGRRRVPRLSQRMEPKRRRRPGVQGGLPRSGRPVRGTRSVHAVVGRAPSPRSRHVRPAGSRPSCPSSPHAVRRPGTRPPPRSSPGSRESPRPWPG